MQINTEEACGDGQDKCGCNFIKMWTVVSSFMLHLEVSYASSQKQKTKASTDSIWREKINGPFGILIVMLVKLHWLHYMLMCSYSSIQIKMNPHFHFHSVK